MSKPIEVSIIDITSHYYPLDEQREMTRRLTDAGIRIWLTDQTLCWWPDGVYAGQPIEAEWPRHTFLDRYVQCAMLAAEFPDSKWAIALDVVRRGPDIMAQTFMTLHQVTGGRVMFALAAGEAKQLAPFGYEESKPFTRLDESVQLIRRLWREDAPFDFDGKTLRFSNAYMGNRAVDGSEPELTTIGFSPRLRRIAAEHCDYVMVGGTQEEVGAQIAGHREQAERAGRDPAKLNFWGTATRTPESTAFYVYETEEDQRIIRSSIMTKWASMGGWLPVKDSPFGKDYHYARDMVPTEWTSDKVHEVLDKVDDAVVPMGFLNEDDIVDRIVASHEAGIDLIRFSDRTAEINPSIRWRLTDIYCRAAKRAREILA